GELVRLMLEHDSPTNARGKDAKLALLAGAAFGYTPVIERLISHGVDINAPISVPTIEPNDRSVLSVACEHGQIETVRFLLDHGANVNAVTDGGVTALYIAGGFGEPEITSMLISRGARLNLRDKKGYTALKRAAENSKQPQSNKAEYKRVIAMLKQAHATE